MIKRPDFFIVGAPRCGTTAMGQFLAAHPHVFMARKEMHVFGKDLQFGRRFYRRNLEAYLSEFVGADDRKRAGEASVWYLFSKTAASELKEFNPDSRIIIMLREPVEMMFSLFHEFRWDGNEHLASFEQALTAESERRAGGMVTNRTYFAQGLDYRQAARFADQVWRYLQVFGRQRVHVILYDEFAANPQATYDALVRFLGLEPAAKEAEFKVVNGSKCVKSSLLQRLLGDARVRSTAISMARKLPRPLFRGLQKAEEKIWRLNTRPSKRPVLDPELRARLATEFEPEVQRLGEMLGRDLSHWSNPSPERTPVPAAPDAQAGLTFALPNPEAQPG
jgi:hypothetical protein